LARPAMHASTPTAEQTATGGIARLACARLKEAGVALEPLLKKTGLTLRQIEDPEVRLRVKDQINLLNHAAGALRDNLLGFHLAQSRDLREFGLLYYVLASSESLSEALQRAAHYSSTANEGILLKYVEGGDVCMRVACVGVSRHLDRHQIEFWMVALVRMCRELTGLRVTPTRVRLTHRRDDAGSKSEFAEFFGGDLEFGAAIDDVAFAASVGQMPVAAADPYLNKILIAYCEEALSLRHSAARTSTAHWA
jgi:hypothetical protein